MSDLPYTVRVDGRTVAAFADERGAREFLRWEREQQALQPVGGKVTIHLNQAVELLL